MQTAVGGNAALEPVMGGQMESPRPFDSVQFPMYTLENCKRL